jgi:hypothetical protein
MDTMKVEAVSDPLLLALLLCVKHLASKGGRFNDRPETTIATLYHPALRVDAVGRQLKSELQDVVNWARLDVFVRLEPGPDGNARLSLITGDELALLIKRETKGAL